MTEKHKKNQCKLKGVKEKLGKIWEKYVSIEETPFNTAELLFNSAEHTFNSAEHTFNVAERRIPLGSNNFLPKGIFNYALNKSEHLILPAA